LILPTVQAWAAWKADFLILTTHAVDFRYPGKSAHPWMPNMPCRPLP
jgi:hypothetical protein